ncbi:MAG: hypothetical protein KAH16_02800, partial [Candidatus Izimaplasma sp.]|nr:hypothetical protein [Candidatus Izimaplasma bacterium]
MLKRLDNTKLNLVVGFVLLCTTFLGYFYMNNTFIASTMWPTTGFVVGLYYAHGKKALPGLVIGILVANLLARFILIDEVTFLTISYSIVFTGANIFQAYIFKMIIPSISLSTIKSIKTPLIFTGAAAISSIFGALIPVSYIHMTNNCSNFLKTLARWSFGDFSGIMIFGTAIIFSYLYDSKVIKSKKNVIMSIVYVTVFSLFSYIVFSDTIQNVSFVQFSFLFMLFFFAVSFFFSYRMIITVNMIYVLMYQFFLSSTVG